MPEVEYTHFTVIYNILLLQVGAVIVHRDLLEYTTYWLEVDW